MKLVLIQEETKTPHIVKNKTMYKSTMMPGEISDKPGKDSMGMEMVPFEIKEPVEASYVSGLANVSISPEQEQLIGVKTEQVKKRELKHTIRAAGKIAHDIELYNALKEYQAAVQNGDKTSIDASKFNLYHMGLSDEQINEMAKQKDLSNLLYVNGPGKNVWVYAQIYENESGLVKKGQEIKVSSIAFPGKTFTGKIKSIDTYLDSETRTLKVRAELPNPEGILKPEMYVEALIEANPGIKLSVPTEAVIDSGTRKIVFVKTGPGSFSPREIITGSSADEYYEVISGLKEGEEVVTSANFLIDSESKLKAAIGK
jgi:Cu(I)/Ag(I) efflux system membrane fusion protein